jgi:hypothetical protein
MFDMTMPAGNNKSRYEITFINSTLSIGDNELANNLVLYSENKDVIIKNNYDISSIIIYDTLGRIIYNNDKVNNKIITISDLPQGMLIFNITIDGSIITKKHLKK